MNIMATNEIHTTPFRAVHPTEIIKDELKARSMSRKELAERMGMQAPNVTRLLKGENITTSIARKLEAALDIPADFWMRLQTQYDRDVESVAARDEVEKEAIATEKTLAGILNLNEIYKRLKINTALFVQEKHYRLTEFLGFDPIKIGEQDFAQQLSHNYKKSDKSEVDEKNQTTWLTLAYIESRKNNPGKKYVPGNARLAARDIATRAHAGGLKEADIKDILNKYCIAYSVVTKLDKTPIDAASMNLGDYPAIITTHRYNDMSRLIFNVLHELGHIEKHMYGKAKDVFVSGDSYTMDSPSEREANEFAQNMLINQSLWNSMMKCGPVSGLRFGNIVDKLKILSEENHLDFNIVVWRWKFESQIYQLKGAKPVPIQ